MNILEEFWYGNIEPAEYDTSSGKEYKEQKTNPQHPLQCSTCPWRGTLITTTL